jgi:hypothetical protein
MQGLLTNSEKDGIFDRPLKVVQRVVLPILTYCSRSEVARER